MSTFQSKHDAWLLLSLVAAAGVGAFALVRVWDGSSSWVVAAVTSLPLAMSALFVIWTLATTDYVVTADVLRIRCGPMGWTIPLSSIQSVQPSRSIIAGPAWSLDRLSIEAGGQELLISPKDRGGFIAALLKSDPDLRQEGDHLTRRAR